MTLIPGRFWIRAAYGCRYVKKIPKVDAEYLLDLPESCRIDNLAAIDGHSNFADVSMAWNELGIGVAVISKVRSPTSLARAASPRNSDGLTLWVDTRDARASHRASHFCHQFHFLIAGGGAEHDQPVFMQSRIHRALRDAPLTASEAVPFRVTRRSSGYILEAFIPAGALNGFDPEQNRRLGFYYVLRDAELGEQVLSVGSDFPYWEDPSLWSVLELIR
jgi:hypothetical protein